MLCRALLNCAVCRIVSCPIVLRCDALRCVVSYWVCRLLFLHIISCLVVLCYSIVSRRVVLCCLMPCRAESCRFVLNCCVVSCCVELLLCRFEVYRVTYFVYLVFWK